ncbi:MAG: hypothetical protein ACODAA_09685 [Gemmatimonadota bacterium]
MDLDTGLAEGNYELYVIPATGGEAVRLTSTEADENLQQWTPDGALVFQAAEGNTDLSCRTAPRGPRRRGTHLPR